MLSIFAAHAEKSAGTIPTLSNQDVKGKSVSKAKEISLAIRLVPGYAQTLLEVHSPPPCSLTGLPTILYLRMQEKAV